MKNFLISYILLLVLVLGGILLIRDGFKKQDLKYEMSMIHYRPIKNYPKWFSIVLGIGCVIGGLIAGFARSRG